ncbi:MAG: hypothetical protein BIFFINMI_02285 [Phycisphaerae bacterium]|nr:hypothetical protein [Phycisphaerae bacterium]
MSAIRLGLAAILLAVLSAAPCLGKEIKVDSAAAIRTALAQAQAGDTILVKPGNYDMGGEFSTGHSGTAGKPITLAAAGEKGYAKLHAKAQIAFRIRSRYWVLRGIHVEGDPSKTEATVFMDGPGGCGDILMTDCKISGSGEHGMKAARTRSKGADNITIEHTELFNTSATGFDLVSGDNWTVRRNYVHDFGAGGGVTYGIFLKGGGVGGVIEGNIVDGKGRRTTLGISFGGGLTGKQWLPLMPDGTVAPEHRDGICRNNIVLNCSDAAYHSNNASNCKFYNNLAFNKASDFQRQASYPPDPLLVNNLIPGRLTGVLAASNHNVTAVKAEWFKDPANCDFRLTAAGKAALAGKGAPLADNPTDFFGNPRPAGQPQDLGPVNANATASTRWVDRRG